MDNQTPQDLIKNLIAQHRQLQQDLILVMNDIDDKKNCSERIVANLQKFRQQLIDHLKLEDDVFYMKYIEIKKMRGEDLSSTYSFIQEIKQIGVAVMQFLEKYSNKDSVENEDNFKSELSAIVSTLNARIETEEEGVYGIYLVMANQDVNNTLHP